MKNECLHLLGDGAFLKEDNKITGADVSKIWDKVKEDKELTYEEYKSGKITGGYVESVGCLINRKEPISEFSKKYFKHKIVILDDTEETKSSCEHNENDIILLTTQCGKTLFTALEAKEWAEKNIKQTEETKSSCEEFMKFDALKPNLAILFDTGKALEDVANVMSYGAKKYNRKNWNKVDDKERYVSAPLRHIAAYCSGEKIDPESNLPHLACAITSLLFLQEIERNENGIN